MLAKLALTLIGSKHHVGDKLPRNWIRSLGKIFF